ncbi:acyltransferase [Patescibacteria group bacterium]|nr:MAG: acyltransferase [Patescibacteria group bacterium]
MPFQVVNPIFSTYVVIAIVLLAVLFSIRKRTTTSLLPVSLSQELKGFAILAIIFGHIGYFLVLNHEFLFPLSALAGVGVDLFLFLSGFGLAVSQSKKLLSPLNFYRRHFLKLYTPLWIVLSFVFLLDIWLLQKAYTVDSILHSLLGFFPSADLFTDVNSPLWYFTFILFFYLLFPLVFKPNRPLLSALVLFGLAKGITLLQLPLLTNIQHLYVVHLLAFPIGIALGGFYTKYQQKRERLEQKITYMPISARIVLMTLIAGVFAYFAYFSGIGTPQQELISLFTALLILLFFILKNFEVRILYLFGIFSYALYLIHWPFLSRYEFFYAQTPAWIATVLNISILLGLSWLLHRILKVFFPGRA